MGSYKMPREIWEDTCPNLALETLGVAFYRGHGQWVLWETDGQGTERFLYNVVQDIWDDTCPNLTLDTLGIAFIEGKAPRDHKV